MLGWFFLFMLVVIGLGWRERKKNARIFSELSSRLAQVEELLLEVCALVEEKLALEELPPLPEEMEETSAPHEREEAEEAARPEEPTERQLAESVVVEGTPEATNEPPQTVDVQREEPQLPQEQEPQRPAPQTQPPAREGSKPTKGKKAGTAKRPKLPPWNEKIIELWQQGVSVPEIARQVEKGQGEVQLIIDLYGDERPQSKY